MVSDYVFTLRGSVLLSALLIAQTAAAKDLPLFHNARPAESDKALTQVEKAPDPFDKQNKSAPPVQPLPGELSALQRLVKDPAMVSEEYLTAHPDFFRRLLGQLLQTGDADGLRELLAMYKQMPNQDLSVFDWGNAVIAMREGKFTKAVDLYRTLVSKLPENTLMRYQMALALMQDQQFIAAKDQFERLRSSGLSAEDEKAVNRYLDYIDSRDRWSFYGGANFIHDPNINNVPPKGTALTFPNGSSVSSNSEPVSVFGIGYNAGADKRWAINDRLYTSFTGGVSGSFYFGHKKYNDVNTRLGVGIGYRNAMTDIELQPSYQYRWYGLGSNGDGSLHKYATTPALTLNLRQWFSPKIRYQGALRLAYDKFTGDYDHQSGRSIGLSNTLLYTQNANRFFYTGFDVTDKNAKDASDAYTRVGARFGWGQEWSKGISTRVFLGLAHRKYDGADFFNIVRKSNELNAGLSVWHRNLHFWDITPKLNINYSKTSGNHPFYNSHDVNVSVDFSKTF